VTPAPGSASSPAAVAIHLHGVRVCRAGHVLLDGIDLDVETGERLAVLGPSGSGKTTLLRTVAGLEAPDEGRILFDERDVTDLPPRAREVGMITQEATLQPHLDVRGNLAFPLRIRHTPRDEERARVDAEARAFSLRNVLRRRPRTLSAGQRHEVALAHSLVRRAAVLLADEPFGRLDPPRRLARQRELLQVQEGYGVTMLLATNDQRVALGTGHRVAVLETGRLVQLATPVELFRAPATASVASFVGDPAMDLHPGRLHWMSGQAILEAGPFRTRSTAPVLRGTTGRALLVGIRPSSWQPISEQAPRPAAAEVRCRGRVLRREFLGPSVLLSLEVADATVHVVLPPPGPAVGELLTVRTPGREVHVYDAATGAALTHGV
jgi:multiple sugar transport system ATP-binding protein